MELFRIAKRRYNRLMIKAGFPECTIGTEHSIGTDNWNIRDMVAECDVKSILYTEDGNPKCLLRHSENVIERKQWVSEYSGFRNFVKNYEDYIEELQCESAHLSQYD